MSKLLALFLLSPFVFATEASLSYKFYKGLLYESDELWALIKGDVIESKYFKLSPSEDDKIAAVLRCTGNRGSGRYKYVDFIIYKSNIGEYKYTQLILTDKERLKGAVTPLMGFEREDGVGTLYFHNLIDFIGFYGSMNQGYLRNPNTIGIFLSQSPKIEISSIYPSVNMVIRPDVRTKQEIFYSKKKL